MTTADDHFSPIADAYVRGRFGYPDALFDFLAGLGPARELAWDCATGSGQAVRSLAERFQCVTATDISEELLRRAPALANVSYVAAPAERSPLADGAVDLVTVAQALHWFDLDAFWAEVQRVLKPAGVLAFWGYNWPIVNDEVDALLDELRCELAPHWPQRSALLHANYASVSPPFAAVGTPEFEATATWSRGDYLAHLGSWSAVRYLRERSGEDPLLPFEGRLKRVWAEGETKSVRWPLVVRVFRG